MNLDLVMVILTALTILVSVTALCFSYHAASKGNSLTDAANKIAQVANEMQERQIEMQREQTDMQKGEVEIQIRGLISSARNCYQQSILQLNDNSEDGLAKSVMKSAKEDFLNAYDEACAKYIDGKVDKERFKKLYHDEIRQIVTDSATKDFYVEPTTKFHATNKVYKEWYDLEK